MNSTSGLGQDLFSNQESTMMIQWRKLYIKAILWLGTEIFLTLIGLDDLADYGEFLYERKEVISMRGMDPYSLSLAWSFRLF